MSKQVKSNKSANNEAIKNLLQQEIKSLKQDIGRFQEKVDNLENLLSKLDLEENKPDLEYSESAKFEHVPVDCKGKELKIGDSVESTGAPYHNGIIVKLDDQWAYIKTKFSSKPRKKAPYNVRKRK